MVTVANLMTVPTHRSLDGERSTRVLAVRMVLGYVERIFLGLVNEGLKDLKARHS